MPEAKPGTPRFWSTWQEDDQDLAGLLRTLHDGAGPEELAQRARDYREALFGRIYPFAAPRPGERVVEVGSGVGTIMEAVLERYPDIAEIVGLDISPNVIRRAQERWSHPKARFELYDGLHFPFADSSIDVVYSCAAIQHIGKPAAFFVFKEIQRVLKPAGHAVLHIMSVHHIPHAGRPFEEECRVHLDPTSDSWWMEYYSFDELFEIFANVLGVEELDIQPMLGPDTFCVHFSKGTGRRFRRRGLVDLTYPRRVSNRVVEVVAPPGSRRRAALRRARGRLR